MNSAADSESATLQMNFVIQNWRAASINIF